MLILYVGTSLVIWIAFRFVSDFIDRLKLKEFDRQLGALLGSGERGLAVRHRHAVRGDACFPKPNAAASFNRIPVSTLRRAWTNRTTMLPPQVHEVLDPYIHSLDQRLGQDHPPHSHEPASTGRPASDPGRGTAASHSTRARRWRAPLEFAWPLCAASRSSEFCLTPRNSSRECLSNARHPSATRRVITVHERAS